MKPFEKCPVCGGRLEKKEVEKLLRGGKHTAVLQVSAEVCMHCGERLYSEETVRYFEKVRNKLKPKNYQGFNPLGNHLRLKMIGLTKALRQTPKTVRF